MPFYFLMQSERMPRRKDGPWAFIRHQAVRAGLRPFATFAGPCGRSVPCTFDRICAVTGPPGIRSKMRARRVSFEGGMKMREDCAPVRAIFVLAGAQLVKTCQQFGAHGNALPIAAHDVSGGAATSGVRWPGTALRASDSGIMMMNSSWCQVGSAGLPGVRWPGTALRAGGSGVRMINSNPSLAGSAGIFGVLELVLAFISTQSGVRPSHSKGGLLILHNQRQADAGSLAKGRRGSRFLRQRGSHAKPPRRKRRRGGWVRLGWRQFPPIDPRPILKRINHPRHPPTCILCVLAALVRQASLVDLVS